VQALLPCRRRKTGLRSPARKPLPAILDDTQNKERIEKFNYTLNANFDSIILPRKSKEGRLRK
jgi:hypothetical protein